MSDHDALDALRRLGPPETRPLQTPPAGLWERIAADLSLSPTTAGQRPDPPGESARVVAPVRRRRLAWLAAAAVVIAIVAVGAVLIRRSPGDTIDVIASSELDRLAGSASGSAQLVAEGDQNVIRVRTQGLPPVDGFYEVWLIDPTVTKMISLGPLRPDGSYGLPTSIDARDYPVVDVSIELLDGDPTHSSNSVLRGTLRFDEREG